jgi:arylsulfatase A-like enzyme
MQRRISSGLAQWPIPTLLGVLHFLGLLVALPLARFGEPISIGTWVALILLLCFLVLFEVCVAIAFIALLEVLVGDRAPRAADVIKSVLFATGGTLVGASLLKLSLTGSHLGRLDLWFLTSNFRQLAGEAQAIERLLAAGLVAAGLALGLVFYKGFRRIRESPGSLPLRSFLWLLALAMVGLAFSIVRYPTARLMARSVAPEISWLTGNLTARPASTADLTALTGPQISDYSPEIPASRPNIALIMLESVPASILESEEAPVAIPNLVKLAEESTVFERAYAPSVHSDYAQMAILSSLHPRKFPQHDYYEQLEYPRTLLWDALAPAGWTTAMFSCQNEGWGNMLRYLRTPALSYIRHSPDWPNAPHRGRGSEAKVFEATAVDAWRDWLAQAGTPPWVTYLNFQATHFPYQTPADAARPFTPDTIDFPASFLHYPSDKIGVVRNRYLNALHYADHYVGLVIQELKDRGEWDNTILAIVADHGEAFYEHGLPTHGTNLFEEQVRSLMMVRFPAKPARTVREPVSLMDLVPLLIRHLGLADHGNFQGRGDVLEPGYSAEGRPFFFTIQGLTSEDGLLLDDWKYTVNWRTGLRQMFDLATDPQELVNRAPSDPQRAAKLHESLSDFLARQLDYYERKGWRDGHYAAALP